MKKSKDISDIGHREEEAPSRRKALRHNEK